MNTNKLKFGGLAIGVASLILFIVEYVSVDRNLYSLFLNFSMIFVGLYLFQINRVKDPKESTIKRKRMSLKFYLFSCIVGLIFSTVSLTLFTDLNFQTISVSVLTTSFFLILIGSHFKKRGYLL
jgi:uncharacterized membrane protein YeiB